MRPRLPATARGIEAAVRETIAQGGNAKFQRDVRTAVQVALDRFVELTGTGEPALPPRIREVFVALGAGEARENRGAEVLLAALRTAGRLMLRAASEALARIRPVTVDDLITLSDATSAFTDELASACTDGLAQQLREQAGEGDRRRRLVADLLLRGGAPPGLLREAVAGIGWPEPEAVVPVLLPLDQARDARFRFGADGVVAERGRDAVLLLRSGPRASRPQLTEALRGRGAVVGPALGWAEVPEAVRLAERTAELAGAEPTRGGKPRRRPSEEPVFVDDHFAALALRGEPGALAVLSARRLAPLSGVRASQREALLVTLESWLRHWGSRSAVAAELFVHPQTVSYRLKRLKELFGEDLDDPATRFELLMVLAGYVAKSPLLRS
jgi:hypothetical protein